MASMTPIPPAVPAGTTPAVDAGDPRSKPDGRDHSLFGADGLTFRDLLDMINPLQHLPVVSSIYRSLTGDEISPGPRLIGGGLFGGFIGLGVAMLNTIVEDLTGKDLGAHVIALFTGPEDPGAPARVMVASVDPPVTNPPRANAGAAQTVVAAAANPPLPVLAPPRPIIPVHREALLPPPRSAAIRPTRTAPGTAAPAPGPTITAAATAPREPAPGNARTPRAKSPAYTLNTELINVLMFSVPVRVGDGARTAPTGEPRNRRGSDRTSRLDSGRGTALGVARVTASQAYRRGLASRTAAISEAGAEPGLGSGLGLESGATFTPLANTGQL